MFFGRLQMKIGVFFGCNSCARMITPAANLALHRPSLLSLLLYDFPYAGPGPGTRYTSAGFYRIIGILVG